MKNDRRIVLDLGASKEYANRPAVGIIRTEREAAKALLKRKGTHAFIYFDQTTKQYREINNEYARQLVGETKQISRSVGLEYGPMFDFRTSDIVLNFGLPWDNLSLPVLASAKRSNGFVFCQIIYDVIPTLMPEFCVPGMIDRFPRFLIDTAWLADAIFCISDCTLSDLRAFYHRAEVEVSSLRRIHLGTDAVFDASVENTGRELGEFVLFVSSIEPRKNHFFIFSVWQRLFKTLGDSLPELVFVGSQGWNTKEFQYFLVNSEIYKSGKIRIVAHLSDRELDKLYESCLFTVYPSLYEGWGLPISESIAYHKLCIASSTSSMPEAAQGLMELLDPQDFVAWVATCKHFIEDRDDLKARCKRISNEGLVKSWHTCMSGFIADVESLGLKTND